MLLAAFVIVLVAAAVQSTTGFGFSLVAVPLLALVVDPRTAVVAQTLPALVLAVVTAGRQLEFVRWRTALTLTAAGLVGMPLGLWLLRALDNDVLSVFIAVAVLSSAALVWRNPQLPGGRASIAGAGVLSGILSTATGPGGPPLVAAMHTLGYGPRELRATLAAVFSFGGVLTIAGYAVSGTLTAHALVIGLATAPAALAGWWAGNLLFNRIDGVRFRQAVLLVLVLSCLLAVVRTANGG